MELIVNGGTAQTFGLTPGTNPNCSTTGGVTTCANLSAAAPYGTDSFTFKLFEDSLPLPGSPTLLSTTTVNNEVVQEGVANQLGTFTLNPVIGSFSFSLTEPGGGFSPGTASSGNAINTILKDPSGAIILGLGAYADATDTLTPIVFTSSQTPFSFSIDGGTAGASGSLSTPADSATLSYSGASVGSTTTITAATPSFTATQTIAALTAPIQSSLSSSAAAADYHIITAPPEIDFYATGISDTVGLSEAGYSGSFTLQSTTCGSWVSFSPSVGNSATSFSATAQSAGTSANAAICSATFSDTYGQTLSVTFSVTTISFGLQ